MQPSDKIDAQLARLKRLQSYFWTIVLAAFLFGGLGGYIVARESIDRVIIVPCGGIEV